jgi:hypothetical protein
MTVLSLLSFESSLDALIQSESAKGPWQRTQTRCSNWLDWEYNKRFCRGQPVSNKRTERARDRLAEVINGELEVASGEEEDQETEIGEQHDEIEQDEEDQVADGENSELSNIRIE